MAAHVTVLLLMAVTSQVVCRQEVRADGLMHQISNGMKFAQDLLGSESVALKVAEFVVRAFQTANKPSPVRRRPYEDLAASEENLIGETRPYEMHEEPTALTPLKHLVKLFGLQPSQISAVAVNALVFVAQMISSFLSGPKRPNRPNRAEDTTSWILTKNSKSLQDLIAAAKNESLPDVLEDIIKEQGSEEETSCIRLLVCKITPYVSRMQKTVFGDDDGVKNERLQGSAVLYRHLPSADKVNRRSNVCKQRHKDCNLNE